jgi:iron complex outermembrane receptor protein
MKVASQRVAHEWLIASPKRGNPLSAIVGIALLVAGACAPALAAEEADTDAAGNAEPSRSDTGPKEIAEVLVTAQRRSESIQSIPVTVTSVDPAQLKTFNVTSALDIQRLAPNVRLEQQNATVTTFLRGIGSPQAVAGIEASVPVYLDSVYYARLTPAVMRFTDVERIEVLEGPQGTLFGRNASGGLVNIITQQPKLGQDPDLKIGLGYSNYDTTDATLSARGSFGSSVAANVAAVSHVQADGWGRNLTTAGEAYSSREQAIRLKLAIGLSDDTLVRVSGEYSRSTGDIGQTNYLINPGLLPDGSGRPYPRQGFYDTLNDAGTYSGIREWGGTLSIEQQFQFATLIDTAAYHHTFSDDYIDADFSGVNGLPFHEPSLVREALNELQLVSNGSDSFKWTAGLFVMHNRTGYDPSSATGFEIGAGNVLQYYAFQTSKSYAGYGQTSIEILRATHLTLGARYTRDDVSASGRSGILDQASGMFFLFPGSDQTTPLETSKVTWTAALDRRFSPNLMAYVSNKEGYKAGDFNLLPLQGNPVKPETVNATELGVKTDWLEGRLRLNATAWYYTIRDLQVNAEPSVGVVQIINAPKAESKGATVDGTWAPTQNLNLRAQATYLDSKYTDFKNAPYYLQNPASPFGVIPSPVPGSADGNATPRSPKQTYSAGFDYTVDAPNEAKVVAAANFLYVSRFYFSPDLLTTQAGYGLLDAQLAYTFPGDHSTVRLWGSNLTGRKYFQSGTEVPGPQGNVFAPAAPRLFGVSFDYRL